MDMPTGHIDLWTLAQNAWVLLLGGFYWLFKRGEHDAATSREDRAEIRNEAKEMERRMQSAIAELASATTARFDESRDVTHHHETRIALAEQTATSVKQDMKEVKGAVWEMRELLTRLAARSRTS